MLGKIRKGGKKQEREAGDIADKEELRKTLYFL